jgi:hypothetical protein
MHFLPLQSRLEKEAELIVRAQLAAKGQSVQKNNFNPSSGRKYSTLKRIIRSMIDWVFRSASPII